MRDRGLTVQGLTTAAGIWLVTAIGMTAGAGMYVESGVVTLMGLLALTVLRRFEDKEDHIVRRRIRVTLAPDGATAEAVTSRLEEICADVNVTSVELGAAADRRTTLVLEVQLSADVSVLQLLARLKAQTGVERVAIEVGS